MWAVDEEKSTLLPRDNISELYFIIFATRRTARNCNLAMRTNLKVQDCLETEQLNCMLTLVGAMDKRLHPKKAGAAGP